MPIQNGKYVAPTWYNDTNPPINAAEMQDICDSIAQLPVANGGTGATSASGALTNLGALAVSKVAGIGNANTPVYFNSSGMAKPMTGQLPISLGGTGMSGTTAIYGDVSNPLLVVRWGNVITFRYRSANPLIGTRTVDLSQQISLPESCFPRTAVYLLAPGVTAAGNTEATPRIYYNVTVTTDGKLYIVAPSGNTTAYYPRFTTAWLTV